MELEKRIRTFLSDLCEEEYALQQKIDFAREELGESALTHREEERLLVIQEHYAKIELLLQLK